MYIIKLATTYFFKKAKRSVLMIVAILISTTICVSSLLLMGSIMHMQFQNEDDFHYAFYSKDKITLGPDYEFVIDENTGIYAFYDETLVNIRYFKDYLHHLVPLTLVEGRFPEKSNEVIVSEDLKVSLNSNLDLSCYFSEEESANKKLYKENANKSSESNCTYTVVGIYQQSNQMTSMHNSLELIYTADLNQSISSVYYVYDLNSHLNVPFNLGNNLITNQQALSNSKLTYYLRNIQMIVPVFIGIVLLCIYISFNTLKNILIATDNERKKEIGLLKSIGINQAQLFYFVITDIMFIGITGISLGSCVGIVVYKMIISYVNILPLNITWLFVILSILINASVLSLVELTIFSPLLKTNAIDDLKEDQSFEKVDYKTSSRSYPDFSWKMFLTYNYRMKKNRKSIFNSFFLLLLCTSIFSSIFFSMIIFTKQYDTGADYIIKSTAYDSQVTNSIQTYNELNKGIYTYEIQRVFDGLGQCYLEVNDSTMTLIDLCQIEKINNIDYYNLNIKTIGLNSEEIKEFYEGECSSSEVLIVYNIQDDNIQKIINAVNENGYVVINEEQFYVKEICLVSDYVDDNDILCVFPLDAWKQDRGFRYYYETINITLTSDYDENYVEYILNEIVDKANSRNPDQFELLSLIEIKNENSISTFILQICLYPLFGMLFVISLINLYQVIQSNIYLKQKDIHIFKAIGIKPNQLIQLFAFEYIEGYVNSAFVISGLMVIVSFIFYSVDFLKAFAYSEHLLASQILAVGFLGVILSLPIILISFIQINLGGTRK